MSTILKEDIKYLWNSFLAGDDKSFSIIYQYYIEQLLSYGYKISSDRDIISDCIQEIFIDLFLQRKKLGVDIKDLKAYLFTALRHGVIKKIKKSRKFDLHEKMETQDDIQFQIEYSFQDQLIHQENSSEVNQRLKTAINHLPSRQKEIFYLKFEEGMDYEEISDILSITIKSARTLLYRTLVSLRESVKTSLVQLLFILSAKKIILKN